MKQLYVIGGTMGVGKTTVCQELKGKLNNSVFLDGDWCWDASPFQVTDETKNMVMNNICFLLNQFINCSAYNNIIFCWVLHEQSIIDTILNRVNTTNINVKVISLICEEKELRERLCKDIAEGKRDPDIIERSLLRIPLYNQLKTIQINTSGKKVNEIVEDIIHV